MITQGNDRKQLLEFLIQRWLLITGLAAIERVYKAMCQFAQENGKEIPPKPLAINVNPCLQIEIIKQHIIEILPEAHFIDYLYESPAPLNPDDFVEMYIADHHQCASKVIDLMQRMKIT
ncbi:MAG: hypothetical protein DRJ03_00775 [Chloroflexi bacterium]|nr:MAG: hypothetical protein DRJ03_00775 [Chloroflexota bacterium]